MSTHTQKGLSLYKNVCFSKMFLRKPDLIAGSMLVKCPVCVCVCLCVLCASACFIQDQGTCAHLMWLYNAASTVEYCMYNFCWLSFSLNKSRTNNCHEH